MTKNSFAVAIGLLWGLYSGLTYSAPPEGFFTPREQKTFHVIVQGDVTPQQEKNLNDAIKEWNQIAGKSFISKNQGEVEIVIQFKEYFHPDAPNSIGVAWMESEACPINIQHYIRNKNVVMHEIGHCIGFRHDTNPRSLMYDLAKNDQYVTQEMETFVKEAYGSR